MRDDSSLIGALIAGRFFIEALLGRGAMGSVFLARHNVLRRRFAIKLAPNGMLSEFNVAARFRREARAAARIEHPHITSVFDFGHFDDGSPYIVMEYVEGLTLADVLAKEGVFPVSRALHVLSQIAEALVAAHAADVIHRDLKTRNVMLIRHQDDADFVKILDFGVAKVLGSSSLTDSGQLSGTPQYMPPEQCTGALVDSRGDIYSFGIVAFELIVGSVPFSGSMLQIIESHINKEPPPPSSASGREDIPAAVDSMVLRCLAKRPQDRYASATMLAAAIRSVQQSIGVSDTIQKRGGGLASRSHSLSTKYSARAVAAHPRRPLPPPGAAAAEAASARPHQDDQDDAPLPRVLEELACSVRDRGLGSADISLVLSLKLEAEDRVFELLSAISLLEAEEVELEITAREREARLMQAVNQLEHERLLFSSTAEGDPRAPSETSPSARVQIEQRITEVTRKIQQISLQVEEDLTALRKTLDEKRQTRKLLHQDVDRYDGQLAALIRQNRSQIVALSDPDLTRLLEILPLGVSQLDLIDVSR